MLHSRMFPEKRLCIWQGAVFFLILMCVSGCGAKPTTNPDAFLPGDEIPVSGDSLVVGSIADAVTLVPILASDSASGQICGLVFNGLVKYDKDLNLVGDLARRWDIEADGNVIVFHLRDDVTWHDGTRFTAADVEFTYKKLIDPKVRTPYSGDFEKVSRFEVVDDFTVRVNYTEPFSPGLASWGMNIMPKHLLAQEDLNTAAFGRRPIGTGPYKFKEWRTQERIILEANDAYFEGRPHLDRYVVRVIPDPDTMFLELQSGGIDQMGLTSLQYVRQTDTFFFQQQYRKYRYQGFSYTYLGYNLSNAKFSDIRVRQAINYAVNKQELIDGVLLGMGSPCTGPFAPRSWAYNQSVQPVAHDPERAQKLLAEAGWQKGSDGWLEKDGQRLAFTIVTNQGNDERKRCAEIIQRRLRTIGIDVQIKIIEWSAFLTEYVNKRNFDAVLLGWSLSLDPDVFDIWHSSKTKEGDFNFVGYRNPDVDALLVQARREFDQAKRQAMYHRIHEIIYNDQPYLFLYTTDSLPIVSCRVHGIEVAPAGIGHNFIRWYVPKRLQQY